MASRRESITRRHSPGNAGSGFVSRLPRFAVAAGAALVATMAVPSPAFAAEPPGSPGRAEPFNNATPLSLPTEESLSAEIERFLAAQKFADDQQLLREQAWRDAQAAAARTGFVAIREIPRTVVTGDLYVTQPGQLVDAVDVHGRILIRADNVTIQNSIVRGLDTGSTNGLIDAMEGHPGLRVVNTKIAAAAPNDSVNGIMGSNFELHNVEIWNVVDAVHVAGSNVLIADSWLHDNLHYGRDPLHADGSHDDSIQIVGGTNITVTRSTLVGAHNAAVMIAPDLSAIANVTISNNRISGGGCSVNISEKGTGAIPGVTVKDNTFGADTRKPGCAIVSPASTTVQATGNTFADGRAVGVTEGR